MKTTPLTEIQHPGFPTIEPPSGGRQGRFLPAAARVFALALLLHSMAGAWVINVQYGPYNNENGQSGNASMAGRTGPSSDTGTTWNSFLGTLGSNAYHGAQASNAALVDSTGNPTSVKLTFLAGEGYAKPGSNTDSLPVFRSAVYVNSSSPTNFVISGLSPGTLYDLYAISGGTPSQTGAGTFHVSGATVSASQTSANSGPFNTFNSSNSLLFPNLAPTADGKLTLTMEGGSYPTSNGFQLVSQGSSDTYTLTYDANGGTGSQSDGNSPYTSGATVTVLGAGTMTKSGDTFAGWNTAANGSGTGYVTGNTFAITAGTTLYAQWAPNLSFVELKDNGGITGKELTLTCVVPRAASFSLSGGTQTATLGGVAYIIEASTDLSTWTGTVANISTSDIPPAGTTGWPTFSSTDFWQYRVFSAFDGLGGNGFIRRVITQP